MPDTVTIAVDPARLTTWSVKQYAAMVESGALMHNRVELIAGRIIDVSPVSNPHAAGVNILAELLRDVPGPKLEIRTEQHIDLSPERSVPQPDIAVCAWRSDRYGSRAPRASDIRLVVEVALSSLSYDRTTKRELYSLAGVPEYWIINLADRQLERFVPGDGGQYPTEGTVFAEGARFAHELLGGEVVVANVLPGAGG